MLEREIPQLQEITGKVWKKEVELKQLKSELAALDRKIQLELAPTPEIADKENEGQQVKPETEVVRNRTPLNFPGFKKKKKKKKKENFIFFLFFFLKKTKNPY